MVWKVLVSAPYFQPIVGQYRSVFEENDIEIILPLVNERMSEEDLLDLDHIEDIDGVIGGDDRFTARVLEKATRLKVISKWGTGIDSIDVDAASRLGIKVMNTPGAFTNPVSDSTMAYVLCFARKIPWMDRDIRNGLWQKRMGVSLGECTLGVIGVGEIGRAVTRRAIAFGMRVLGTDIAEIPEDFVAETGIKVVTRIDLLQQADFVSLNCTLNPSSNHIIDAAALSTMKDTAFLINTARGPLVDGQALADALKNGRIAGAALDVFEHEPLPADSPLRTLDNCLFAPHNSNSSPVAWQRVHENTLKNLLDVLRASH
jgi:D-3-phosphoglycerate dehydrogenase / 2-oxoglutarate reductase